MKRDEKIERELRIKKLFAAWCKKNNREPDNYAFVDYDATQQKALLNHQKAKEDGYYHHLLMQAQARIDGWAKIDPLRSVVSGKRIFPDGSAGNKPTREIERKTSDGRIVKEVVWAQDLLSDRESLSSLLHKFRREIEAKTNTLYGFAAEYAELNSKTRKNVQQILLDAEEAAYSKVSRADAAD